MRYNAATWKRLLLVGVVFVIVVCGLFLFTQKEYVNVEKGKPLSAYVGKYVTVRGVATDAMMGAAVLDESFTVYLEDLQTWPDTVSGKSVSASGRLKSVTLPPPQLKSANLPNADMNFTQRAAGTQYFLTGGKWVVEERQ